MPDEPNFYSSSTHPEKEIPSIAFIGCGAVGRCLGRLFQEAGLSIAAVCCRSTDSAFQACRFIGGGTPMSLNEAAKSTALIIIATPDNAIPEVEASIASSVGEGRVVIHLSGGLSSSILKECRKAGAAVGSMHPLQSFADAEAALKSVPGSIFACEGDESALAIALELAARIGGKPIRIATEAKTVYHAAAAAASNFMIAPLLLASDLMEAAGIGRETGLQALTPLILGTAKNASLLGVPEALTGPIERGDRIVIRGHLKAIEESCPSLKDRYLALARMTVDAALRKGSLSAEGARDLLIILNEEDA